MENSVRIYIGLGSNINSETMLKRAARLLRAQYPDVEFSPVYRNHAVGFSGDDFFNLVATFSVQVLRDDGDIELGMELDTEQRSFSNLLKQLRQSFERIESSCGRNRALEIGKGARTLDIDLLLCGELEGDHEGFTLPRADLFNRCFVWQPLLDIWEATETGSASLSAYEKSLQARLTAIAANSPHDMSVAGFSL